VEGSAVRPSAFSNPSSEAIPMNHLLQIKLSPRNLISRWPTVALVWAIESALPGWQFHNFDNSAQVAQHTLDAQWGKGFKGAASYLAARVIWELVQSRRDG
jgi:hypothetical protein